MWRNLCKQFYFRKLIFSPESVSAVRPSQVFINVNSESQLSSHSSELVIFQDSLRNNEVGCHKITYLRDQFRLLGSTRGYVTSAEALVSTSEEEDIDELKELKQEINKEIDLGADEKQPRMVGGMKLGKYHSLRRRQIKMETESWEKAAKEYQELLADMCDQKLAPNLPYIKSLFLGWFEPLKNAIAAEQDLCKQGKNRTAYAPYFDHLPPGMMAVITMHRLMGLLMTGGGNGTAKVVQAASHIGESIEHEVRILNFIKSSHRKNSLNKTSEKEADLLEEEEKLKKKVKILMKKQKLEQVRKIVSHQDDLKPWGQAVHVKVGSRLIQILIETAYIQPPVDKMEDTPPDIRPAFAHTFKLVETDKGSMRYGVIECDPLVRKGLERTAKHMVIPYMPMLVPPLNWTGYARGAHLFLPSYILRTHGASQQRHAFKRAPRQQLEPVFQALNILGTTKWKVNKRILSVVDVIWANGGRLAGLVDCDDIPLPMEPDTEDETELRKWRWKVRAVKKQNSESHSKRCDIELKLAVARTMKDEEGFYYPHNLDFRGRAYPMHPYLNHLGSDLCRGILQFAEGRPLGKSGLRWLKVHLANVYGGGVDKLSYDGRIAFAESHVDDIFDSAERPLEGKRWWLGAEDPFQCLATCINLSEALRDQNPESTISYLPIHQDGSCNGLQHYAALGRDKMGAAEVNLIGGDKPADVYTGIAARVLDIMKRDAAKDPATDPNALCARQLINHVNRKLVKQTVMTSVYGVTYIGARNQIKKRLKERAAIEDDSELFSAACYAAKTTLTALGEMFESARNIMSWLGDCAKLIAMENHDVCWNTPIGLPVVQPYRKIGRQLIKTSLQILTLHRDTDRVMPQRQRTAFPPNFVHSLDGSHMMMTAIACSKAGLNFAGVHDSYWTHACDVDIMNKILREKFVELYEAPILENLLASFQESFPHLNFPPLPERGDFDIREVLESEYFFN